MIILASKSKLRNLIMESSELDFKSDTCELDERAIEREYPHESIEKIVEILACAKAGALRDKYPSDVIIGADTFATLPDGIRLHKVTSEQEAIHRALLQAGQTISIRTGLAVLYGGTSVVCHTVTDITYENFDERTIRYLFKVKNRPEAGGLGFFIDSPGFTFVKDIRGSYLGAMGLPMEQVRIALRELGYVNDTHK